MFSRSEIIFIIIKSTGVIKEPKILELIIYGEIILIGTFLTATGCFLAFGFGEIELFEIRIPLFLLFRLLPIIIHLLICIIILIIR